MKSLLSRIGFPFVVTTLAIAGAVAGDPGVKADTRLVGVPIEVVTERPDTVIYPVNGYKRGWTKEDFLMDANPLADSLFTDSLDVSDTLAPADTLPKLTARDTIKAPDSLRLTDPIRYKYYVALLDRPTYRFTLDSLLAVGDTLEGRRLDSLYVTDSLMRKQLEYDLWYAGLSDKEKRRLRTEERIAEKTAKAELDKARKDSLQTIRDSILRTTPRILETFAFADSMQYKRIVRWTHEQEFHKITPVPADTGFNYRFNDYPFLRNDVNATWLGVAGSPVQYYNYFNRKSKDKVSFYEALESWGHTPSDVTMYNTKTPYTELGYSGTLLADTDRESDNLHLLTSQNITPEFNFTLVYDRFGGGGILNNESTANKNTQVTANYLGKRYMAHAGYLYNGVNRSENGGLVDLGGIRDTTLNARELDVFLSDAKSKVKKNTLFLDQQYRIPFSFINRMKDRKMDKELEAAYRDSVAAAGDTLSLDDLNAWLDSRREARAQADTLDDRNITTAFIGHSTEFSTYRRIYTDGVRATNQLEDGFYNKTHYINPNATADSMRVQRIENRVFLRLQPWSEDAIVSKLNVGIGDRMLTYYQFDPTFTRTRHNVTWNSAYLYAGVEGRLRNYINWDAKGEYVFLGNEINDLSLEANLGLSVYPFRRARKSPLSLDLHFDTSLDEPEFYNQHLYTNHYKWDNEFSKQSVTRLQGRLSIPRWKLDAGVGYALLANNIYYDTLGVIRQNTTPMSVLAADLHKEFVLGILHLDNRVLFQVSSNPDVLPLPTLAVNLKYFVQFRISQGILLMQIGANGLYNTAWNSPAWNPALGVFHNQVERVYNNGPVVDAFVNMQWKRATIFVKYQNANQGWPMKKNDYFSADRYIVTQRVLKLGIYWPFYTQPLKDGPNAQKGPQSLGR
jgi:hypothetical protein